MKNLFSLSIITIVLLGGCAGTSPNGSSTNTYDFNLVDKIKTANIKTLHTPTDVAAVEFDKECEHPVESFSLVDSAMTVGALFTKLQMAQRLGGQKNIDSLKYLKEGAKQINWLPIEVELLWSQQRIKEYSKMILDESKNKADYEKANKILSNILATVGESHDYNFKILLYRDKGKAAVTLPGGTILITKSALHDENYAIFAIAHEISHTLKRHETMELQSQIIDGLKSVDELSTVLKNPTKNINTIMARGMTNKAFFMKFHEDQELGADACGVAFVKRAFPEKSSLIIQNYYKTLPENDLVVAKKDIFDFMTASINRHPGSKERKQNLIYLMNKKS